MRLSILYWNVGGNRSYIDQVIWSEQGYDLIAIQEPVKLAADLQPKYPPCPARCNYRLVYGGGRAALYIHKRLEGVQWKTEAQKDWCSVQLGAGDDAVTVYSIYSPTPRRGGWTSPIHELRDRLAGHLALVGDFNLHHLIWDRFGRTQTQADDLLMLANRWGLRLVTPPGEPTR